jgi:hypothetical protein
MATPVTLPGVYTAIIEVANTNDPSKTWRNTYDFFQSSLPQPTDPIANGLRQWQVSHTHTDAHLSKMAVYNWSKGRQPYPLGQPIWSQSLTTVGDAATAWGYPLPYTVLAVGGEVVLRVDREHPGGFRPGRLFLRALINEGDVSVVGSGEKWGLTLSSPLTQAHLNSIVAGSIGSFLNQTPPSTGLCVVQYSPKTNVVHGFIPQSSFLLIGASTNKQTRKNKR